MPQPCKYLIGGKYCRHGCTSSRRVCHFYVQGRCNHGNNCRMIHELPQPEPAPSSSMPWCHRLIDRHGYCSYGCTWSRRVCHANQKGWCNSGNNCPMIHEWAGPSGKRHRTPSPDRPPKRTQYQKDLELFCLLDSVKVCPAMVKSMYKYQSLAHHPDKAPRGKEQEFTAKMQDINNAFERLMRACQ